MSLQSYFQYRKLQRKVRQELDLAKNDNDTLYRESRNDSAFTLEDQVARSVRGINHAPLSNEKPQPGANEPEYIIVGFSGPKDDDNPKNWSNVRKVFITLLTVTAGLAGGWASGNDSTIIPQAQEAFGVSDVAESLSTGLYLVAFGVGTLTSGPYSETVGRNPIYLITLVLFMLFIMASALAPNLGVQLAFRFFAGWAGCTSITLFAGTNADLWSPTERMLIFVAGCAINFCSVFTSPVVGAFIGESTISWRWAEWIAMLIGASSSILIFLFVPETYAPQILSWKAAILRKETGNPRYRSERDLNLQPLWRRLLRSTWRPFDMLIHELSVVLFTAYLSVVYIVSFGFLTGYTFIFGDVYGLSQSSVGLCFLGLDVGILIAVAIAVPVHFRYNRNLRVAQANGQTSLPPEDRLWIAIITGPCLPVGLFWMAWTSYSSVSFWVALVGSSLIGISFFGAFIPAYLYTIDAFEASAASAVTIAACVRYVAAGAMIPVSIPMYENLGVHWALTLLGCVSLVVTPVPFVMWKFGGAIRKRSRAATKKDIN